MSVYGYNGDPLHEGFIDLAEANSLSDNDYFGIDSEANGERKVKAYNYLGNNAVLKQKKISFVIFTSVMQLGMMQIMVYLHRQQ